MKFFFRVGLSDLSLRPSDLFPAGIRDLSRITKEARNDCSHHTKHDEIIGKRSLGLSDKSLRPTRKKNFIFFPLRRSRETRRKRRNRFGLAQTDFLFLGRDSTFGVKLRILARRVGILPPESNNGASILRVKRAVCVGFKRSRLKPSKSICVGTKSKQAAVQ